MHGIASPLAFSRTSLPRSCLLFPTSSMSSSLHYQTLPFCWNNSINIQIFSTRVCPSLNPSPNLSSHLATATTLFFCSSFQQMFIFNFYLLIFETDRQKSICCSTYWLILLCALTADQTCKLGSRRQHLNQLSVWPGHKHSLFICYIYSLQLPFSNSSIGLHLFDIISLSTNCPFQDYQ